MFEIRQVLGVLNHFDAIIVGAGIAGSSCALQLSRLGVKTLLLDRQTFPRHKTCGEFLSPESGQMLDFLGIQLQNHVHTSIMNQAKIIMPNGGEIQAPFPGPARGISRFELDNMLHEKATEAGCDLLTQATVTGIRQLPDDSYEVEVKQKSQTLIFNSQTVIGAYGTKKLRGAKTAHDRRDQQLFVGIKSHFSGIEMPPRVDLFFCEGGYVGISPIENNRVNIAALVTLEAVQGSGKSVPEMLKAVSKSNSKLAVRLAEGIPVPGTQAGVAPIRLSNVPEPWSEYPHIGDALLMIPPLCGDGMSIALRSSILVAQWTVPYLQGKISFADWKEGYTEGANKEFTQLLRRSRRIQKLAFARTNRFYPYLVRLFPGVAHYLVKTTRLPEMKAFF